MGDRLKRLVAAGILLLLSIILMSGIYQKWIPRKEKKLTIGVFAGSYWDIENGYYYRILDDAIAKFRREFPEYEVTYTSGILKSDYSEWLAEKLLQGDVPDLFFVPGDDIPTFADIGALRPLTNLITLDREFDPGAFYSSAYLSGQENGVQVALPYECAPNMMFVNKTILDREGIPLPDPDWTWEDFLAICGKVTRSTDGTGVINQYGVSGYSWEDAFSTNGVELFDEEGRSCDFTTPRIGEAISFLERLQAGNSEWECITMPAGPSGDNFSRLDTLYVALSSRTSQEEAAWELMKILTSEKEIQKEIFDYSEGISPLVDVTESEETADMILEGTGTAFNMDTLHRAMEKSVTPPRFAGYEDAREQVSIAVRSILDSNSNVQMEQIIWNRTINNYLKTRR